MKYLIVGLGNPGADYDYTRHNIGFEVLDRLAAKLEVPFEESRHGLLAEARYKGRSLYLLKPNTFMNRSGKALRYWLQELKLPPENSLTVLDDLNLPFGTLRLKAKGGSGGHNGLKDIEQLLGHSKYPRLKFGIGDDYYPGQQVDYVLGQWGDEESEQLPELCERAAEACLAFTTIGMQRTMNEFNG